MPATAKVLAQRIHATLEGPGDVVLTDARSLLRAEADHLSFIDGEKRLADLQESEAGAVVAPLDLAIPREVLAGRPVAVLRVAQPLQAFLELTVFLRGAAPDFPAGVDPRAAVDPTATLGPGCVVRPLACIGAGTTLGARCVIHSGAVIGRNCKLGDDVVVHANATVYDGSVLGHRVILHGGVVIGADGFGYRFHGGKHNKIPQLGWVELGDDVEVGAGTTIDRGTIDPTIVGPGTKIDNQVQIGHNCEIGAHNILIAQVGIGGSCTTGRYVTIAGQVGIADHLHLGDGALIGAKAGVIKDVPPGGRVLGAPAMAEMDMKRILMCLPRLPQLVRDVARMRQALGLDELESRAG